MRLLLACVLAAGPAAAFWLGARTKAAWAPEPIAVDGFSDGWEPRPGDDDEGFVYAFANDARSLYLLIAPHTRETRDQLAGAEETDFSVWFSTRAARRKDHGFVLRAPGKDDAAQGRRMVRYVGIPAWADPRGPDGIEVKIGPLHSRGVVEARVPLSLFGPRLPARLFVGLEAPALKAKHTGQRKGPEGGDRLEAVLPLQLWVRVALAQAPPPR